MNVDRSIKLLLYKMGRNGHDVSLALLNPETSANDGTSVHELLRSKAVN